MPDSHYINLVFNYLQRVIRIVLSLVMNQTRYCGRMPTESPLVPNHTPKSAYGDNAA